MQSGWERFIKGDAKVLNLNNGKTTVTIDRHDEGSGGSTGLEKKIRSLVLVVLSLI